MKHLGDFDTSTIVYGKFTTFQPSTGAPFTLAGTPALSVYKDNSTTQSTTGVTLTVDFDSVTGLHHYAIDTSADGAFYAAGSFFDIVITTGTVDSVSAVGVVVGSFTIRKNSALKPATAGRTIDVSASGEVVATGVSDLPTNAELATALSGLSTLNSTDVANAVWNAATGDYTTPDTLGGEINDLMLDVIEVKAKTDQMTFTITGQVDANTESINGATVNGNGTSGNLWRGA